MFPHTCVRLHVTPKRGYCAVKVSKML